MATTATASTDQPPPKATPLRRATYVNVDKLIRSQYEIDLQRLTDELAKLKARKNGDPAEKENENIGVGGTGGVDVVKPNAWATTKLSVLPGGPLRSPLPHSKYHHQSRLQPPRDGFNLCLLVGKVELVVDKYRVDGSRVLVAEVEVGDETGSISLRARDEQIDLLRQVSSDKGAIVLRNCTMELYQGKHLRLAVSKWGKMNVYPDGIESTPNPPLSMNRGLNFSLVDLNIVATAKIPDEPAFPVPVATVHHKPQKQHQHQHQHYHHHAPKHFEGPSGGRGTPRNRSRSHGHYTHHQNKKKDDWQYRQHQHRPRSGSHNMGASGGQYLLQHQQQQSGGSASPPAFVPQMHYQQYTDASSVYSYPSQQGDQSGGSPHRQFLPNDHYKRQQHILYQQYELQQRHAHQMHMLQQQQETQRRMLEQQQQQIHSSLIPDLSRVESHESGGEYNVHTPVAGMGPPSLQLPGSFPPTPNMQPTSPPMQSPGHPSMSNEYQYGSLVQSPMGNVFPVQGEGQQQQHQQQQQQQHQPSLQPRGVPTYATIISPPPPEAGGYEEGKKS